MADDVLIRTVLARECDTINEYLELAARAQSPEVRALLLHIAEEEREHVAVCVQALRRLDPEQAAWFDRPHEEPGAPTPDALPAPARAPGPPGLRGFTVGSLVRSPR